MATRKVILRNARLVDGTGAPACDRVTVVVEDGTIVRVGAASDATPDGADVLDLDGTPLNHGTTADALGVEEESARLVRG